MSGLTPIMRRKAVTEKKRTRPTYSAEFKAEALVKCAEIGLNRTSQELGVARATLKSWSLRANSEGPALDNKPSYQDLEKENRRLKRELGYVNEINKVLKKSTAIFSNSEMGGLR